MKRMTFVLLIALLVAAAMSAPEGTRDKPAKFTVADAVRTAKHHLPQRGVEEGTVEESAAEVPAAVREHEGAGEDVNTENGGEKPSAAHESKRVRRSLKEISKAFHGTAETKLVAIPITHGAKTVTAAKAGTAAKAAGTLGGAGVLSAISSLGPVPVIAAVVKGAKLAAPVLKPVVITAHFAGKALAHKVHTVGKIVDHKVSKLGHLL